MKHEIGSSPGRQVCFKRVRGVVTFLGFATPPPPSLAERKHVGVG